MQLALAHPLPTLQRVGGSCAVRDSLPLRLAVRTCCAYRLTQLAMVFLARPRRAAEAAAPPTPALHLRGGFDAGFCVRGEARDSASGTAAAAPAAVQAARRAPAFASLSRALFQLAAAPAPTKCVARPRGALLRLRNPTCTFAAAC